MSRRKRLAPYVTVGCQICVLTATILLAANVALVIAILALGIVCVMSTLPDEAKA